MSGLTGYLTNSGTDLSFIFQSGTTTSNTGFLLSSGSDISTIFKPIAESQGYRTGLVNSSGQDISTLFNAKTPIPLLINGCSLWLDANDVSKIVKDVSNQITTWTDKSTNNFSFTQSGTNTLKPIYTENSLNGKPTIQFTSSKTQHLIGDSNATNFGIGTNSYALFAVFKTVAGSLNNSIYAKSYYGVGAGRFFIVTESNYTLNCRFTHADGTLIPTGTDDFYTYKIISMTINRKIQNKDTNYINGTLFREVSYPSSDTTNYTATANRMLIGAYNANATTIQSGYYLNGNIAEIISYTNSYDMSDATRQTIEGYLAWKWGIQNSLPISHPYYNVAP